MSNKLELLFLFKKRLIEFLDALIEKLPSEKDLITMRILFGEQIPIEQAMQIFSKRILPYETMVVNEDENFFMGDHDLFDGLRSDKVGYFKNLWTSNSFTQDDKIELWKWFKVFLKLAKKYQNYCSN